MFDFHKLLVYNKAKDINREVLCLLKDRKVDYILNNQLKRASISILLNIAEGVGRFTMPDKRNFYIISRGSVYECVALFDILLDEKYIDKTIYDEFFIKYEELSKMLYRLINVYTKP